MLSREQKLRAALGAATIVAGVLHVGTLLSAPLGLACVISIGELLAPPPRTRDTAIRVVTICGIIISTLVVVGLLLDALPGGLTRSSWSIAIGSLAIGCALSVRRPASTITAADLEKFGVSRLWAIGLTCAVLVLAFAVATIGANDSQAASPLAMFVQPARGGVDIVVNGGSALRQYVVRFDGPFLPAAQVTVGPGTSARVRVPPGRRRLRVDLLDRQRMHVLRYVILAPELRQPAPPRALARRARSAVPST